MPKKEVSQWNTNFFVDKSYLNSIEGKTMANKSGIQHRIEPGSSGHDATVHPFVHHRWPSGFTYFFQMLESKDSLHDPIGNVSFVQYYYCVCWLIVVVRLVGLIGLIWLNDWNGNSVRIGRQFGLDCLRLRHICWARLWVKDCVDKQDVINEEPKRRCHFFRPKLSLAHESPFSLLSVHPSVSLSLSLFLSELMRQCGSKMIFSPNHNFSSRDQINTF